MSVAPGTSYAVAAMALYGLGDLVYKRGAAAGVQAHQFMMVQAWCFSSLIFAYAALTVGLHVDRTALWGAGAGLFAYIGFYNFARSLAEGAVSVNAPIFRLNFTVTAALAIALLGEPLTAWRAAGLAAALAAVWLLLGGAHSPDGGHVSLASVARVLLATLALGLANLLYKVGLNDGGVPARLLAAQAAVFVSLATAFAAARDRGVRPPAAAWRHAPLAGALLVAAFMLLLEALARGDATVLVPIAQMGFVVTAVAGFVAFGEPFSARKGVGLAVALAALGCLAAGWAARLSPPRSRRLPGASGRARRRARRRRPASE